MYPSSSAGRDRAASGGVERPEFSLLIEENADAIVLIDEAGIVLFANPAAEGMFGRAAGELVGSPIGVPVTGGETTEINLLRPGDDPIEVEMRVAETSWQGRPVLLANLRDVTTRRLEQERLRQAQKMEVLGQLTAGIAHDFNNLLTVAIGNLELLRRDLNGSDGKRRVDATLSALARAERLTSQLLAFARKQHLEPEVVEINRVLIGLEELLQRAVGAKVEIAYHLTHALPPALIDRNQFETALLNIAANARDAMPGGGRLMIETGIQQVERPRVVGDAQVEPGRYLQVIIRDTGEGMSPQVLRRAFEPFFSTKESGKGTGLGLAMVYGFIRQSGGYVDLQSRLGRGTRITLYLPCAPPDRLASPSAEAPATLWRGSETVLIVEDDIAVRALTCAMLQDLGYTVIEASNAKAALEILTARADIDLVFSDIVMPGSLNGLDLARVLMERQPKLPIVLTSGYSSHYDDPEEIVSRAAFIHKPFHQAELSARLREALDGGRTDAEPVRRPKQGAPRPRGSRRS